MLQYRFLFSVTFIVLTVYCATAQSGTSGRKVIFTPHTSGGDSSNTIAAARNIQSNGLLASNSMAPMVSTAAKTQKAAVAKHDSLINGYRRVPLAGEQAYFGEKSEYVNEFVRKYLELHNSTLTHVEANKEHPFSLMDNALEEKKMPKELKYLAVIESALNNNAVSHAGAVGPWQLMESTARMMGLTVNGKKDERTDWNKSTFAAIKYLDLLYSQMNDWLLVIAAYNSGPTPVQRAIDMTGSRNFWDIKEYLPKETQGHVLAFIATASIFENLTKFINLGSIPLDFSFGKEEEPEPVAIPKIAQPFDPKKPRYTEEELANMVVINITEPLQLEILGRELGVDTKLLNRWNPDYDMFVLKKYSSNFYGLHLPKDKIDLFMQKKSTLMKKSKAYYAENKL
jgi:membrane-bound lytic murein transglycosylase D